MQLIKVNRLVSPTELYVGASMIVPAQEDQTDINTRVTADKQANPFGTGHQTE